jgi:two-component system, cell cycle sensor histidine kinase DivJ
VGLVTTIRGFIDSLVHPSARVDALSASRHRAFIAPRLIGSLVALAAFPVYLALRGVPSVLEIVVLGWLIAPVLIAYFLSRTGRYESAHVLSSLALTGLVTVVAIETGGIGSFSAIWLVLVPLEAALSASRRVVALASSFALAAAGLLIVMHGFDLMPATKLDTEQAVLAALGIVSAALYATGVALGAEQLARTSSWLLHSEEDRYRLLARNMADVITRHRRNGAVMFVSPAAESLFGAKVQGLLGYGLFERVHVADRPAYLTALSDAAASGEARSVEFRVRRDAREPEAYPAGQFIWVEMRCRPIEPAAGERKDASREVVAVMRDTTERKLQEQAVEEARAEAERANAQKSAFLATMSHELRTPLNAIIGFSEMLMKEAALRIGPERRQEYAHLINGSGHHLLSVVNGILDMSKIETGNFEIRPERFAPEQVIADCCEILALKARDAGIELVVAAGPQLPDIVADKRSLNQIMFNLLSNAIKFSHAGGRVAVGAAVDGDMIVLTVADTGVGIGDEDLARVGNPFFQARSSYDRRHDGTGLGLSIVKGLAALHGGRVDIRSRLGEGTRVCVSLPLDCRAAHPAALRSAADKTVVELSVTRAANPLSQETVKKSA